MNKDTLKDLIIKETNRISEWTANGGWSNVRSLDIFSKENSDSLYEGMQASRGLSVDPKFSFEKNLEMAVETLNKAFIPQDIDRQKEIKENIDLSKVENVLELGFRIPKLLKFYKELGKNVSGIDIVNLNCLIGQYLGYDCFRHDLTSKESLNIKNNTLIISYHCFEHLKDPLKSLKKIKSSTPNSCYFHIEVPTENLDSPNVKKAHCFAFKSGVLKEMLLDCGFKIIKSIDNQNQRCLCQT